MTDNQQVDQRIKQRIYLWWRRFGGQCSWGIIAVAGVLTLVLGIMGFDHADGNAIPFSTRVYLALQLFTMESGSVTDRAEVGWKLETARWTAATDNPNQQIQPASIIAPRSELQIRIKSSLCYRTTQCSRCMLFQIALNRLV